MGTLSWLKRNSLELQFWGYESGNVVASITGAGGIAAFWTSLKAAVNAQPGDPFAILIWLATEHAETFATLGVITMVVAAYPLSRLARSLLGDRAAAFVNAFAVPFALVLLGYAVVSSANFFTVSACAFVVASCLLRAAGKFPVLLKLGGLFLFAGGFFLAIAGVIAVAAHLFGDGSATHALAASTFLTGFFVAGAGLLTYKGGCFAVQNAAGSPGDGFLEVNGRWVAQPLARHVDPVVERVINRVVTPSLFWVPLREQANYPFWTSMLARLPWRVVTGTLALATGTAAGQCFALANLLWAVGDVAIGALDLEIDEAAPTAQPVPADKFRP